MGASLGLKRPSRWQGSPSPRPSIQAAQWIHRDWTPNRCVHPRLRSKGKEGTGGGGPAAQWGQESEGATKPQEAGHAPQAVSLQHGRPSALHVDLQRLTSGPAGRTRTPRQNGDLSQGDSAPPRDTGPRLGHFWVPPWWVESREATNPPQGTGRPTVETPPESHPSRADPAAGQTTKRRARALGS